MRKAQLFVLIPFALAINLAAAESPLVHRGVPQRQGRTWVEEDRCTIPTRSGGRLIVRADMGAVVVVAGAVDHIQCSLRLTAFTPTEADARASFIRSELMARRMSNDGAFLELHYAYQDRPLRRVDAAFTVEVPTRYNLDVETQGGSIQISDLDGELRASTAGGDIRTGNITGTGRLQTAAGNIELGNFGQKVEAHTAGGSIRVGDVKGDALLETSGGDIVAGIISGTLHAQTAAGNITLHSAEGAVVAETAGGQIRLGECGGAVHARTAAGSILLDGARGHVEVETAGGNLDLLRLMAGVHAQTAAGNVLAQINASGHTFTPSSLESSVGDVEVYLPPELPLNLSAQIDSAAGFGIASDFPMKLRRDLGDLGGGPVQGLAALSGGGTQLILHTTLGNIEIHKLDANAEARLKSLQDTFWRNWQAQWKQEQVNFDRLQKAIQEQQRHLVELQKDSPEDDQQP